METDAILVINGGSSSIKFTLYQAFKPLKKWLCGKIDRIGLQDTTFSFHDFISNHNDNRIIEASSHKSAGNYLVEWLEKQINFTSIRVVGHRVVHGMKYTVPERVTQELLDELYRIIPYDPDHLPSEIELIEIFRLRYPNLPQIACFDTEFHRRMPRVAQLLPIPRYFNVMGIQRYGFHGISYAYLMEELIRVAGEKAANGRVILAHLGNGASLAAVQNGKSIDTSMGFTPTAGLPMGTRTGDLDPGVAGYLMKTQNLTPKQFNTLVNQESGLLGISETSSDMRDLLKCQANDIRAAEAVEFFCYQTRKWIGSYAAVLGGLDTLVFAGGIGENSPEIRERICKGLEFLGIKLDNVHNSTNALVISIESSPVTVRVIKTDEELMIAKTVYRTLNNKD